MNKINKGEEVEDSMTFEVLKGTRDSEPATQIQINSIVDTIRENFEKYGFRPFDTPLIEYFDTLTNKYDKDAEIVQEIFKVTDRGNRQLGLRYDLTIPLCRYIAGKKQIKLPFKRYAIGKVFRDGPIKKGRDREFMQCDADIVGIKGQAAEAETLKMFFDTYTQLGIKAELEINNIKILRGLLTKSGVKEKFLQQAILTIDKLKKIGVEGVKKELKEKKININFESGDMFYIFHNIFNAQDENLKTSPKKKIDKLKNYIEEMSNSPNNEELVEGINELDTLTKLLKKLKVKFDVNFSMARGLNYYTGNVWEMYDKTGKVTSSIGSGGRYDKGIGNYIGDGKEYPAFGVSFGIVPIMECLNSTEKQSLTQVLIAPLDEDLVEKAIEIATKLREERNVEISYDFKLKKAFDYANFINAEELAIIGRKDVEKGVFTLKNLETGKEKRIKF